jgi:hypothetical protein
MRQLPLPVSTLSQRWVSRATNAPGFGNGAPGRAWSKVVSPDRRILRTGFRPMPRSRLIRPTLSRWRKWFRRTFAVVSRETFPRSRPRLPA